MSEQEVRELWDAIDAMRKVQAEMLTQLSGLTAMLRERCEARFVTLVSLETRVKELEGKYSVLDRTVLRNSIIVGGISALMSSAATAVVVALVMRVFG